MPISQYFICENLRENYSSIKVFIKKSIHSYLKELASNKPIPGGGSVSALSGALGTGLLLMVINFTFGKEAYKCYQRELSALSKRLTSLKKKLTALIDKDAKTYLLIVRAYELPRNTERENSLRKIKIQETLKKSTLVTLDILTYSQQALRLSKRLLEIGNKNLISDVGVGACMLEAGIKGALLNIEINLTDVKEARFIDDIGRRTRNLVNEAKKDAYYVITETSKRILKK